MIYTAAASLNQYRLGLDRATLAFTFLLLLVNIYLGNCDTTMVFLAPSMPERLVQLVSCEHAHLAIDCY